MADSKISALTEVTTPSAADVFLALVGGVSKKIAYSNLRPITQAIANLALSSDSIQSTTLASSGQGQCILLLSKLDGATATKSVQFWIDNEYQGAVSMAEALIVGAVSNSADITVADANDFAVGDVVLVRDDTYDQGYTNALRYRIITAIATGDVITVDSAVSVTAGTNGTVATVKSINTWYHSGCVLKLYTTPDSFNLLKDLTLC